MPPSRWVRLFGLGVVSGICAPAVLVGIVMQRGARRRLVRFAGPAVARLVDQRDSWCCEFTAYELLTGEIRKSARR